MGWLADETGLEKTAANYAPLTPLSHLRRAAEIHADRIALAYRGRHVRYADYMQRVTQLAAALAGRGIRPGEDRKSVV